METPYDRIARDWNNLRTDFRPGEKAIFDQILSSLPPKSRVLDLGCGTGRPIAKMFLDAGHRVLGIDESVSLLKLAKQRLGADGAEWRYGDLVEFEFSDPEVGDFEVAICWDALFFLKREVHRRVLENLHRALRPDGWMAVTSGGSANPPFTDTMFGVEFSYDSFPPDEMRALVSGVGFEIVKADWLELPAGGREKGRYVILARKRAGGGAVT